MSLHAYPRSALVGDYVRAGVGFVLTAGPLLWVKPASVMVYILGCLAMLFAIFGFRTYLRQATRLGLTAEDIRSIGPFGTTIRWDELRHVELRFFSTQRSRREGWMQLKMKGAGKRIQIDSTISAFSEIAHTVVRHALDRGVPLDEYTRVNFQSLGVELPDGDPEPAKPSAHVADEGGGAGR